MNKKWTNSNYDQATPYNNHQKNYKLKKIDDYMNNYDDKYVNLHVKRITFLESTETPEKRDSSCKAKTEKVKQYFYDYCEGTSLHGLKYVGIKEVTLFERFFWIISFAGAIAFAAYFISNIYEKWGLSPVIVGINPQYQSVSDIPFPAITICNMNLAQKTEADKVMKGFDYSEMVLLSNVCNTNISEETSSNKTLLTQLKNWEFIKAFILKVSQPCNDLLIHCKWRGSDIPCKKIFNSALTDEGVCCSFNRVSTTYMFREHHSSTDFNISYPEDNINWTPEDGYPPTAKNSTWPYRGAGPGEHIGLTLIMNISAEQYYCSSSSSVGLKIRLHSPVESPMIADYGFFIHPRKEVRVSIKPTMDQASMAINKIPINKRQCYFSIEKQLLFYRTYTKTNCELECLSNYTARKCGCVPFYLPKDVNQVICDKSQESCYRFAKTEMDTSLPPNILCKCLPACNEIQYGQEHSIGDISNPHLRRGAASIIESSNLIILHFFYHAGQFRSYEKSELFGFTDFLSNSGGLLGLFLGFSFLSTVEILYHLTLKLWCISLRNYKKKNTAKTSAVYPFAK